MAKKLGIKTNQALTILSGGLLEPPEFRLLPESIGRILVRQGYAVLVEGDGYRGKLPYKITPAGAVAIGRSARFAENANAQHEPEATADESGDSYYPADLYTAVSDVHKDATIRRLRADLAAVRQDRQRVLERNVELTEALECILEATTWYDEKELLISWLKRRIESVLQDEPAPADEDDAPFGRAE